MPWKAKSGNEYKLCLLDTNAISELLKYPDNEGKGFISKLPPNAYAPAFTIYNIIEVRRDDEVYDRFLKFFSIYPCFILKPHQLILEDELYAYNNKNEISVLFNAFNSLGDDSSYNIRYFFDELFSSKEMKHLESTWRDEEIDTIKSWLSNKDNFIPSNKSANLKDAERYIEEAGLQSLIRLKPVWVKSYIDKKEIININEIPSLKTMLYSIYYRLYDPAWKQEPGEVTDVKIMAAAPYVDVIITEKFQANIFNKINKKVKNLNNLIVYRLKDIRIN